jgi:hypothetical protein
MSKRDAGIGIPQGQGDTFARREIEVNASAIVAFAPAVAPG